MTAKMSTHFQVIIWCERVAQGERAKAEMKKKKKKKDPNIGKQNQREKRMCSKEKPGGAGRGWGDTG